ncbi:MAG: MFS transporter [Mycobacteriales bacterium]
MIVHAFTDPARRAKALGSWAAITGVALAAGPVVGGVLTDTFGWRVIFLINVPVALFSAALTSKLAPETGCNIKRSADIGGQLAAIVALTGLTYGLIQSGPLGWSSPEIIGSLVVAVLALAAFMSIEARNEHRHGSPMLPLTLFRSSTFSAGLFAGLLVNFGLSGVLFVLSLFFQQSRGYSAFVAGLAFLPLTLPTAFNPIFTGRLVAKIGPRLPAVVGFLLMAAGTLLLAPFTGGSAFDVVMTVVGLVLLGFGVSFAIPSLMMGVVSAVPKEQPGIGAGALNSARQTGSVLGVALLGSVFAAESSAANGSAVALVIAGLLLLIGAVVVGAFFERAVKI